MIWVVMMLLCSLNATTNLIDARRPGKSRTYRNLSWLAFYAWLLGVVVYAVISVRELAG